MYLSQIRLQPQALQDATIRNFIARGAYGHHQLLCRLFDSGRQDHFLFRHLDERDGLNFYTLSQQQPAPSEAWDIQSKPFAPQLAAGQRLRFSVRINPTVNRSCGPPSADGKRGHKRRDMIFEAIREQRERGEKPEARQILAQRSGHAWLAERLNGSQGFSMDQTESDLSSLRCEGYRQQRCFKGGRPISISTLDCSGVGTVTDPDTFLRLLGQGLGPAKSFGCGLILIRPA